MKYLYYYKTTQRSNNANKSNNIKCNVFTPKIGRLFFPGELRSIKLIGVRLLFQTITLGKAKIYVVSDGRDLIHTSYVIPKCSKFAFMNKDDYEIGPCFTYPQYRGKGIYPAVLQSICNDLGNDNTIFYMIVDEDNTASIKGIEKAGFKKFGIVKITKFTKRYLLETKI